MSSGGWRMSSHTTNGSCVEAFSMEWRKSSHSSTSNCVEVGVARTSSQCANGNCVEVEGLPEGGVAVRDSKDRDGPVLLFTPVEWIAFLEGVRGGEFDLAQA